MRTPIAKNILAALGGLFMVEVIALMFLLGRWETLDSTSHYYVMQAVPAIFTTMDVAELERRATPKLFAGMSEDDIKKLFNQFKRLGKLETVEGCEGNAALTWAKHRIEPNAEYECKLKFEKDRVSATLVLLGDDRALIKGDYDNGWKIAALHVNSDYLVNMLKK